MLITIDCLRYDITTSLIRQKKMPNIQKLAKKGLFFKRAISTAPWTAPSVKSFLTSTYPLMYDGYVNFSPRKSFVRLLRKTGYSTISCQTNPWISRYFGFDGGFTSFIDDKRVVVQNLLAKLERVNLRNRNPFLYSSGAIVRFLVCFFSAFFNIWPRFCLQSDQLTKANLELMKDSKPPFFTWLHYMDCHEPHIPNKPNSFISFKFGRIQSKLLENKRLSKDEILWTLSWYKDSIIRVDESIGLLLSKLEGMDINLDNTYFVLTSDHGQEFFEHGRFGHLLHLYDELIRVPLIMAGPELSPGVVSEQMSLIHLPSTMLGLLGFCKMPRNYLGRDLSQLLKESRPNFPDNPAISEEGVKNRESLMSYDRSRILKLDLGHRRISYRSKGWKYIYNENASDELYNLNSDPGEQNNLFEEEKEIAKEFLERIDQHIRMEEKTKIMQREYLKIWNLSDRLGSTSRLQSQRSI
ncbi:MAG: sulfatase-like hydrolase/transferase [Candidatus Hodarchaeota archaeon]